MTSETQHVTYDIIGMCCDIDDPDVDDEYVVVLDSEKGETTYDIPPKAPIFNNIYCGSYKDFE